MDNLDRDKIDDYLLDKMDKTSRIAFEQQMASDEALAKEVALGQEAFSILDIMGDQKMRRQLDKIHNKVIGKPKPGKAIILSLILIGTLLLGLAYYFFIYQKTAPAPEKFYAQYFEPYPLSLASRGDTQTLELQQVNALYKNQQYEEALPIIENLIIQSTDTKLQIAAGISALQTGAYETALSHFNFLIDRNDPLYQSQAKWYAAMTALKMKDDNLAKQYLQSIVDSNDQFKQEESQAILDALD